MGFNSGFKGLIGMGSNITIFETLKYGSVIDSAMSVDRIIAWA